MKSFQDHYPDDYAICYGCGRLNPHGLHIESYWEDGESVCRFKPEPHHTGGADFVYGGLIASLMDCHGAATASAEKHRREGLDYGRDMFTRFVTASLHVDFLAPVPIDGTMVVRATVTEGKSKETTPWAFCQVLVGLQDRPWAWFWPNRGLWVIFLRSAVR